ncbi:MAG: glycosyltransferase [Pseudomonadota bacterium]
MSVTAEHFDILVIADCRFPGGTSTAVATEIRIQAAAGYRTGLIAIKGPVLKAPHRIHPEIRGLIDHGACRLLSPDGTYSAALTIIHHPQLFTHPPQTPLKLATALALLIVHHPPFDAAGEPFYETSPIDANLRLAFGQNVLWAPVGPVVREQLEKITPAIPLLERDWHNLLDFDQWVGARTKPLGGHPVIGRHARPDPLKWPEDRPAVLEVYPDDPAIDVRILGGGAFLDQLIDPQPGNWTVLPFGAEDVSEFLADIDFFVFFHHPRWVEAFGRAILEALAAGCVVVLPPHFEPLFGEAACYAEPGDVVPLIQELHGDPQAFAAHSRRGVTLARQRFGSAAHLLRLQDMGVWPQKPRRYIAAPAPSRRPVLFMTSNGIGLGHLTRLLAVAHRLDDQYEASFVTMSQAMRLVEEAGFLGEYLPFHVYLEVNSDEWNPQLAADLDEIFKFHTPAVLVFDGNMPYQGLVDALAWHPGILPVWVRRGFWRQGSNEAALNRERYFHMIIEPGDIAGLIDDGPTRRHRDRTRDVAPIRFLDRTEFVARDDAITALDLDPARTRVMVQLGSGNNVDLRATIAVLGDEAERRPDVQFVLIESPIQNELLDVPTSFEVRQLYPVTRYLNGFDAAISAVGYNSFHELLLGGCPTLFIPNEHPSMDDQLRRARYAQSGGMALVARHSDPYDIVRKLDNLLDPAFRARMRERLATLDQTNGAHETAEIIAELAMYCRADIPA